MIINLKLKSTDFTINQTPTSISFICPYCEEDVTLEWNEIETPDYWGDDWEDVQCPYCEAMVHLEDYELD